MPRTSKAARITQEIALPTVRPKAVPPPDLTEEQRADWMKLADQLPEDLLLEAVTPLLSELARHMSFSRQLSEELAGMRKKPLRGAKARAMFADLLKMHERESMRISMLSVKLRLSPQVREAWKPGNKLEVRGRPPRPWEDGALLDLEPIEMISAPSERKN